MPYYQGDFYTGDYYAGDPGFFSGIVGLGKRLFGSVLGRRGGSAAGAGMGGMVRAEAGAIIRRAGGAISRHPVLSAAGAAGTIGALGGVFGGRAGMVPAGQRGFHISRRTGRLVKNRHMRVTNPKALRRAIRRTTGFAKLAMRTIHLVHPKRRARFGGFKKRRRK